MTRRTSKPSPNPTLTPLPYAKAPHTHIHHIISPLLQVPGLAASTKKASEDSRLDNEVCIRVLSSVRARANESKRGSRHLWLFHWSGLN